MKRSDFTDFFANVTHRKKTLLALVVVPCVMFFAFGPVESAYEQMPAFLRDWANALHAWATVIVFVGGGMLLYRVLVHRKG